MEAVQELMKRCQVARVFLSFQYRPSFQIQNLGHKSKQVGQEEWFSFVKLLLTLLKANATKVSLGSTLDTFPEVPSL
jgi:hypothetical protein